MLSIWRPFGFAGNNGIDREFERFFADGASPRHTFEAPAEIYETETELSLKVDLPGVADADLQVGVENNVLTVRAARRPNTPANADCEGNRASYHLTERGYGVVTRSFRLPTRVDTEQASARFDRGVLTISLPKRTEARARTIEVKVQNAS